MISVGKILEGAFGVFREHFTAVAIWGGIYLAGNIATWLAIQPLLSTAGSPLLGGDPIAAVSAMTPVWVIGFLSSIMGAVLYTASMRSVLRPDAGGFAFLRLGMDELRTIGLLLLFSLVATILFIFAALVFGLFIGGMAGASDSMVLTTLLALPVGLVVFGMLIYFIIRFSLAFPLTLHRGAFAIGEAWTRSRGHFWKLFGAALVITMIGIVVSIPVNMIASGGYLADIVAAAGDPEAAALAAERQAASLGSFNMSMILQSIGGAVLATIWLALSGGSAASAARLLIGDEFDDAEEVFG